jgi:hypothetical protein
MVDLFASMSFPDGAPLLVRLVWAARWKLGEWFDWDEPGSGVGERVASLRDRLPKDLKGAAGPDLGADHPFTSVYQLHDEYAAELANQTVHGVVHFGWVSDDSGGHHAQMAVLVKPNGRRGALYMAAIKPFRHLIVYPALMCSIARDWQRPTDDTDAARR